MVHIRTPDFSATVAGRAGTTGPWAGAGMFGEPVPLRGHGGTGWTRAPPWTGSRSPAEAHRVRDRGLGNRAAPPGGGESFPLGAESVLWLGGCDELAPTPGRTAWTCWWPNPPGPVPAAGSAACTAQGVRRRRTAAPGVHPGHQGPARPGHRERAGGRAGHPRRPDRLPPRRHRRRALPHRLPPRVLRAGRVRAAVHRRAGLPAGGRGRAPWSAPARCTGSRTTPARTSRSWSSGHRRRQTPSGP